MVTPEEKDLWRDSMTLSFGGIGGPFSDLAERAENRRGAVRSPTGHGGASKCRKGFWKRRRSTSSRCVWKGAARRVNTAPIFAGYFDELLLEGAWEMRRRRARSRRSESRRRAARAAFFTEAGFRPSTTPLSANPEQMPGARLSPAESLAKMTTAADLAVDLIASEPDVAQPTHISFDERGRMWVAQYRQYPYPAGVKMVSRDKYYRSKYDRVPPAPPHHDRGRDVITVHEDTDGDGVFDKTKVVLDGLNMANAALRGHGGMWVMQTPYLLFYPDANGDDIPDADPEVRLAGFGLEDTHSVANGLAWGPDGWLYGAQGSTTTSRVVRPGVDPPDFAGVYHEGCMVWRYHPRDEGVRDFRRGRRQCVRAGFRCRGPAVLRPQRRRHARLSLHAGARCC